MKKLLSALVVVILLLFTFNTESLWTDEAFSAFIASHPTFASCWSTLLTGDSSDLQMFLYYLYLHVWSQLCGQSEIAFRSDNIPFVVLYACVLVWASHRLFHSNWVWAVAALSPLALTFASDTRPYFDVITFSFTGISCLLAYLKSPSPRERQVLPWLVLLALLTGATFHMLTLLVVPPLLVLLAVFWFGGRLDLRWPDWKWPLVTLTPVGLALFAYFTWTFRRGASYSYAQPDLLSMGSVVFRFVGLSGFAPNRRYDLPFKPFLMAMGLSSALLLTGLILAFFVTRKSDHKLLFRALACALGTGLLEVVVLSFAVHQQIEFRHLSTLLPLLLLLLMTGLTASPRNGKLVSCIALAVGLTWLCSDLRLFATPDYRREDFRSAVRKAIELHNTTNAAIALAADPVAAAYYGLDLQGPVPCFPLTDSCADGFAKVPWDKKAPAQYALTWSEPQITAWIEQQRRRKLPWVLLISRTRHQSLQESPWWRLVQRQPDFKNFPQYGFFVYFVQP